MEKTPSRNVPNAVAELERELRNSQRLRVILANCEAKTAMGIPLSVKEETLLAELYYRKHLKPRERVSVDNETGAVTFTKTIDAEPIMDAMKDYGDFVDRHSRRKLSQRLVGSLDPVTAANWARETGLKIGTREFAKFAIKRLDNDIDYRKFKVGG